MAHVPRIACMWPIAIALPHIAAVCNRVSLITFIEIAIRRYSPQTIDCPIMDKFFAIMVYKLAQSSRSAYISDDQ